jgi:hypothetical protein
MYMYFRWTTKPTTFVPLVAPFSSGGKYQNQRVTVVIGSDGIVRDVISNYGGLEVESGLGAGGKADMEDIEANKRPK